MTPSPVRSPCTRSRAYKNFVLGCRGTIEALVDAFRRGVFHRNLSSSNVLVIPGQQVQLIDWELGRPWDAGADPSTTNFVTGTLDTMSWGALRNLAPLPHDELELSVYVFAKTLCARFGPPPELKRELRLAFLWDDGTIQPKVVANTRFTMWGVTEDSDTQHAARLFRQAGQEGRAELWSALLRVPMIQKRQALARVVASLVAEGTNTSAIHARVIVSLQETAEELTACFEDVSSFA